MVVNVTWPLEHSAILHEARDWWGTGARKTYRGGLERKVLGEGKVKVEDPALVRAFGLCMRVHRLETDIARCRRIDAYRSPDGALPLEHVVLHRINRHALH